LDKQVELDPTRYSTYPADLGNVSIEVNEVIPVRGFNYRINSIDDYHRDNPNQATLGTERKLFLEHLVAYKDVLNSWRQTF